VVGVLVALIAVAALAWLVVYLVDQERKDDTPPIPTAPADTGLLPPSDGLGDVTVPPTSPADATPQTPTGSDQASNGSDQTPTGDESTEGAP